MVYSPGEIVFLFNTINEPYLKKCKGEIKNKEIVVITNNDN